MTHAEALAGNRAGLTPTDCPGELAVASELSDDAGRPVTVYSCARCGRRVVVSGGLALNDYEVPDPRRTVAALAAALSVSAREGLPPDARRG